MKLANKVDTQTVEEQMRDLGVPIERPKRELTDIKWVNPPNVKGVTAFIRLTEKGVYLTHKIAEDLHYRVMLGSGEYRGEKVVLVRHDPNGYRPTTGHNRARPSVARQKVIRELLSAGLKPGLYEPVKIKGGWMGVPCDG